MRQMTDKEREEFPMGANETLLLTLRPHPFSFIRYYSVGIVLLIWIVLTYWLNDQGWLTLDSLSDDLNSMLPALFLGLGGFIVGKWLVSGFNKGFRYLFWFAIIALLVVTGMFIWYWEEDPDRAFTFAIIYGIAMGVLGIVAAEAFRRAFHYMVTNQRVVIRYKLLSIEETNMRFEKIEDFEIIRPFSWRIVGLGTIRPYTGTEDAKADKDLGFHGPKEAMYGIRNPNKVKRQLIEIILERDQWDKQMVDLLEDQKKQRDKSPTPSKAPPVAAQAPPAPAPDPAPASTPVPTPASDPAPAESVAYYQPAPAPDPEPSPAPSKNYERIDPSNYAAPEGNQGMSPPPPDEETDPKPQPSPVRTMFPEAREPDTPLEMQDKKSMDFQTGERSPPPQEDPESPREEEEGWRRRDGGKPRKL
jgi:hypothetical protein